MHNTTHTGASILVSIVAHVRYECWGMVTNTYQSAKTLKLPTSEVNSYDLLENPFSTPRIIYQNTVADQVDTPTAIQGAALDLLKGIWGNLRALCQILPLIPGQFLSCGRAHSAICHWGVYLVCRENHAAPTTSWLQTETDTSLWHWLPPAGKCTLQHHKKCSRMARGMQQRTTWPPYFQDPDLTEHLLYVLEISSVWMPVFPLEHCTWTRSVFLTPCVQWFWHFGWLL